MSIVRGHFFSLISNLQYHRDPAKKKFWKSEHVHFLNIFEPNLTMCAAPRGAGLSARRLCKIRTHQNVEVYGRSEDETPRKCILQAENIMPGSKKLWEEHLFPSEKIVFSPFGRKNNHFFLRKQKFASEFFCPWHNVSTQKEHIFPLPYEDSSRAVIGVK